jgi:hypothetical protein
MEREAGSLRRASFSLKQQVQSIRSLHRTNRVIWKLQISKGNLQIPASASPCGTIRATIHKRRAKREDSSRLSRVCGLIQVAQCVTMLSLQPACHRRDVRKHSPRKLLHHGNELWPAMKIPMSREQQEAQYYHIYYIH